MKVLERDPRRAIMPALWPIGALSFAYWVLQASGTLRTDFFGVWDAVARFLDGRPPYARVFPYPPSALVLMLPFGFASFTASRIVFLVLSAAAMLGGAALSLRLFGIGWRSPAGAVVLIGITIFIPALAVLRLANVDALLLAGYAGALLLASRGRWVPAGALLGLTFALKPVLLPLILLPVLWRRWRAAVVALAVPAVLSVPPLLIGEGVTDFFSVIVPTLLEGNAPLYQPFNVSFQSALTANGFPEALAIAARVAAVGLAAWFVWARMRRDGDEALRLVEVSGVIMLATFVGFSFSWAHYVIYLLPLFVSVAHPDSLMRSWIAWVAVYAVATGDAWSTERIPSGLSTFAAYKFSWGCLLLLAVLAWGELRRSRVSRAAPAAV